MIISMRILRFKNVNEVAEAVEEELRLLLQRHNPLRFFAPTGKTPLPLYERFRKNEKFWRGKLDPIQIDDFIQEDAPFLKTLNSEVVGPLGLNISAWNPEFSDTEASDYVSKIMSKPVHLALLGLGPNGHVGFHEPGHPANFLGGRLEVSEETQARVEGAATREVFTFGVGAFLRAEEIILIVTGKDKAKIFHEFEKFPPSENLPGSLLKVHPNLKVFTDISTRYS
jgi:glucosamine-6-phosphate deaminase